MVTSANKIVALSGRGIAVTSENAKYLVRYLADVENANEDYINVQYSTSKLGWLNGGFLPYDTEVIFDGDVKYREVKDSIQAIGNRNRWFECVSALRRTGKIEIKFMLASAFSSVLIEPLGGLPYFVDLWGGTGGGKTVCLMLAASVWADPDNNAYIKDYQVSPAGIEVTCDLLNHLPLLLDDTSKKDKKVEENFEGLVYDLCSGKGKTRSNKELGLTRENHWKNCILTNGEHPLSSYVTQGGAINRILELEAGEKIFPDVAETLEIIKKNYGHAGREFVEMIKETGVEEIRNIQKEFLRKLSDDGKMEKQSLSLSIILTADKLATDYLFKDGQYIDMEEARAVLVDKEELSENERCYRFVLDKIAMNPARFDPLNENAEKWGIIEDGYAVIYNSAFDVICREGKYSKKSFLSWAAKKGLVQTQNGNPTKLKKLKGNVLRCVFLKLDNGQEKDDDGFSYIEPDEQMELPFK